MNYFLGVDLGSSGLKLTLLGCDGSVLGPFGGELVSIFPAPGWVEQEPGGWYQQFVTLFREMVAKTDISPKSILGIAVDAATHTTVLLDDAMQPVRNAILWNDQRSASIAQEFQQQYGQLLFQKTYHSPSSMWSLCQMEWVRRKEPHLWKRVRHILFAKDYLRLCMGGENVTDYIDAQGSMLLNMQTQTWDTSLCALVGLSREMLPALNAPTDLAGCVSMLCASQTGLLPGTPIYTGTSDTAMELLACGAIHPGDATMKLATSGRICIITDKAFPSPLLVNYSHVIPGLWYPGSGTRSCATSLRWFKDTFCRQETLMANWNGQSVYSILDEMAGTIPAGSEGLLYHPYLLGEFTPYQDPDLRASFLGASMRHSHAHFTRAIMEGCVFSLMDCYQTLMKLGLPRPQGFRLIGGGARGQTWSQVTADVFQMPVSKPAVSDSSYGSAMLAAVAGKHYASFQEAVDSQSSFPLEIAPNPRNASIYREMFALYQEIPRILGPVYHKMAGIQST